MATLQLCLRWPLSLAMNSKPSIADLVDVQPGNSELDLLRTDRGKLMPRHMVEDGVRRQALVKQLPWIYCLDVACMLFHLFLRFVQVLGDKAFEKFGKWFISLHFSDQLAGSYKKVLTFKFVLPDANNMAEMTRLVALVPYYIDLVGRYKLSSHARTKTEAARTKVAQEAFRELQSVRQEALQKKKAEKKKLMEEAEAKLSAEVLRKKEEKERSRQKKKGMPKVKMLRS